MAEKKRLAVEPGLAAVPPLDRRRMEDVLAQLSERGVQRRGADAAFQSADDAQREFDRRLDARAVGRRRKKQVRGQDRLDQRPGVEVALAVLIGQGFEKILGRWHRLTDEEAEQLADDEPRHGLLF